MQERPYPIFPFAAVIGQDSLRQALLLTAINPRIGGVLIRGEKGTAKSTLVRGLAALLPEITVTAGCPFACAPGEQQLCPHCAGKTNKVAAPLVRQRRAAFVDLPLNATEDRLAGGIDFPRSLKEGQIVFAPGLLASAHRGLLYVDEVNLLDDHLVDLILDAAASGENRVEREGISFSHPARFTLVGTMNPEEGELRPQLLDRFGLCVEVRGESDPEKRVRLLELRENFDANPRVFIARYQQESEALASQIARGREILPAVRLPDSLRRFIGELCQENNVAGHRADLVLEQAVCALAALQERTRVSIADVQTLAPLVLLHRRREAQPPPPPPPQEQEEHEEQDEQNRPEEEENKADDRQADREDGREEGKSPEAPAQRPGESAGQEDEAEQQEQQGEAQEDQSQSSQAPAPPGQEAQQEQVFAIGATFTVKPLSARKDRLLRRGSGRRSRTRIAQKKGRYVKSSTRFNADLALDATLRAAAPHQKSRRQGNGQGLAVQLTPADLRGKIREKRIGNLLLFVVDASGSMGARGRMAASKGAVMSLLLDAYRKRDKVAMISFRKNEAVLNLPPTTSVDLAGKLLADMPVGGRTPLSAALARCHQELRNHLIKNPGAQPIVILLSDGKGNVALGEQTPQDEALLLAATLAQHNPATFIVVDTEEPGLVTFGLACKLAAAMQAQYCKIDELKAKALVNIIQEHTV
ncbi:MAG: putative cobaltochelatase [Desulfobulbaceae bacterium]|nr:putative cobaltochelatase [Desulfobulbaceae bacterium]